MKTLWSSNVGEGTVSFSPTECHLLDNGRVVVVTHNDREHGVDDRSERSLRKTLRPTWPQVFSSRVVWMREWKPDDRHFTAYGWNLCSHLVKA